MTTKIVITWISLFLIRRSAVYSYVYSSLKQSQSNFTIIVCVNFCNFYVVVYFKTIKAISLFNNYLR